ncbi:MAG: SIMPL domain-containing protein [Clostridium sp.]|uniref:SIMPL domain-containing protein n=1 Tax=Clostridium sp. TaxID=1506 RepID=UPI0030387200
MDERTIKVNGHGKVSVLPDTIEINMVLTTVKPTYEEAMKEAGISLNKLRNCLREVGFDKEDVKTTDFRVNTKYENVKDMEDNYKKVFIGYEVTNNIRIEFEQNSIVLGKVLDVLSKCEATPELAIQYKLKDDNKGKELVLKNAINDAKVKAKIMADTAGVRLGKVVNMEYTGEETPIYKNRALFLIADSPNIDLQPETLETETIVNVVFRLES